MAYVDIDQATKLPLKTCLLYGPSRAGKTHLCGTFPQPAILAAKREGGWETLVHMDRSKWYDPKVKPVVFTVNSIEEMMGHLNKDVIPAVTRGTLKTIVIELTFYADDGMRAMDVGNNGYAKYEGIFEHVLLIDNLIKSVPGARAVYTALAQTEDKAKDANGVMLPGKQLAKKLPALTDLVGYMHVEEVGDRHDRVLELIPYGDYTAGHRYGSKLPHRVRDATFRHLEDLINGRAEVDSDGFVVYSTNKTISIAQGKNSLPPLSKKA